MNISLIRSNRNSHCNLYMYSIIFAPNRFQQQTTFSLKMYLFIKLLWNLNLQIMAECQTLAVKCHLATQIKFIYLCCFKTVHIIIRKKYLKEFLCEISVKHKLQRVALVLKWFCSNFLLQKLQNVTLKLGNRMQVFHIHITFAGIGYAVSLIFCCSYFQPCSIQEQTFCMSFYLAFKMLACLISRLTHLLVHLKAGRWIMFPHGNTLSFLLPEEAIDFHMSRTSCCTSWRQAIWLQFKASQTEESHFQRTCTAHSNRLILVTLLAGQMMELLKAWSNGVLSHEIPGLKQQVLIGRNTGRKWRTVKKFVRNLVSDRDSFSFKFCKIPIFFMNEWPRTTNVTNMSSLL